MQNHIKPVKVTGNAMLGVLALVGVAAFTVVRAVPASIGSLDAHRAVGEVAIVWIVALCAFVMLTCQRPRSRRGWAALALVAICVGTSGIFRLWRCSRPDEGVVKRELDAVKRERLGPPASTAGRYDVTVTPKQSGS